VELIPEFNSTGILNHIHRCPRCNGFVFRDGDERWCLQCGFRLYTGKTLSLEQAQLELRKIETDTL